MPTDQHRLQAAQKGGKLRHSVRNCGEGYAAALIEQAWHWTNAGGQYRWFNAPIWDIDFSQQLAPAAEQAPEEAGERRAAPARLGWRLLTAGGDGTAKVWEVVDTGTQGGAAGAEPAGARRRGAKKDFTLDARFLSVLHTPRVDGSCNAAKWSPGGGATAGTLIATAHDNGQVLVWRKRSGTRGCCNLHSEAVYNTEHWSVHKGFCAPKEDGDVAALCWTPDASMVVGATSGKGATHIWRIDGPGGSCQQVQWVTRLCNHEFGRYCSLALDPAGQELVSCTDDQRMIYYRSKSGTMPAFRKVHVLTSDKYGQQLGKRGILNQDKLAMGGRPTPAFSPDGLFLLMPGCYQNMPGDVKSGGKKRERGEDTVQDVQQQMDAMVEYHGCRLWLRRHYDKPLGFLPSPQHLTPTAAAFSPRLYEPLPRDRLDATARRLWGALEYQMLFAVACRAGKAQKNHFAELTGSAQVLVYHTASAYPVLQVTNTHEYPMTRVQWTPDGRAIFGCSRDGYISCVDFAEGALPTPLAAAAAVPPPPASASPAAHPSARRLEVADSGRGRHSMKTVLDAHAKKMIGQVQAEVDEERDRERAERGLPPRRLRARGGGGEAPPVPAPAAAAGAAAAAAEPAPAPKPVVHVLQKKKKKAAPAAPPPQVPEAPGKDQPINVDRDSEEDNRAVKEGGEVKAQVKQEGGARQQEEEKGDEVKAQMEQEAVSRQEKGDAGGERAAADGRVRNRQESEVKVEFARDEKVGPASEQGAGGEEDGKITLFRKRARVEPREALADGAPREQKVAPRQTTITQQWRPSPDLTPADLLRAARGGRRAPEGRAAPRPALPAPEGRAAPRLLSALPAWEGAKGAAGGMPPPALPRRAAPSGPAATGADGGGPGGGDEPNFETQQPF